MHNCTITVCLKAIFHVCPENGTKKENEKKIQQLCQGSDLVTLQLHKLFDGTFVFDFTPEAAFPASAVGYGKYGVCVCVMANENIVAPLCRVQTSDFVMYCTYGWKGRTILHHNVWLSWQERERSL